MPHARELKARNLARSRATAQVGKRACTSRGEGMCLQLSYRLSAEGWVEDRGHELVEQMLVRLSELPAAGLVVAVEAAGPVGVHVRGHCVDDVLNALGGAERAVCWERHSEHAPG